MLPVDEYKALRERANPQPVQPTPPPVDATLTRIDYDLRIENDAVAGRALLTIDVMRDGWTRVQIPAGLMVRDARIDGQPVSLVEGPPPHVLLSRSGRVVLTLDIALPLTASAGSESIALPASAAPISRARPHAAAQRRRSLGLRRLRRRAHGITRRKPVDAHSAGPVSRSRCRGNAKRMTAAPNCRCARARASPR